MLACRQIDWQCPTTECAKNVPWIGGNPPTPWQIRDNAVEMRKWKYVNTELRQPRKHSEQPSS